jgi:predicted nucleic acid-binding protein
VAFLFDTDAVSGLLRSKPAAAYVRWVRSIPREDQFISAITAGELYHGAFRSSAAHRHLHNIETRVLPYDAATAKVFGQIRSTLEAAGTPLDDADLQIAATAIHHGLELVTCNLRHFQRVPGIRINRAPA